MRFEDILGPLPQVTEFWSPAPKPPSEESLPDCGRNSKTAPMSQTPTKNKCCCTSASSETVDKILLCLRDIFAVNTSS